MEIEGSILDQLKQFTPLNKACRLLAILQKLNESEGQTIVQQGLDICKQASLVGMYELFQKQAATKKLTEIQFDDVWVTQTNNQVQTQVNQKNQSIELYKNQQNKQSIRHTFVEIGDIYLKHGLLDNALYQYERANNYNQQNMTKLDFLHNQSVCCLLLNKFENLKGLIPTEAIPKEQKLKENYAMCILCQALRALAEKDFANVLNILKNQLDINSLSQEISIMTSKDDLSVYLAIASLYHQKRKEVELSMKNQNFIGIIQQNFEANQMLNSYLNLDYQQTLQSLHSILKHLTSDLYLSSHITQISQLIHEKLLKQYLQPFKRIKIQKLVDIFQLERQVLEQQLATMIQNNQINFLIDPIEDCLVQKVTDEIKSALLYQQSVKAINSYLNEKQFTMLKHKMLQLQNESQLGNAMNVLDDDIGSMTQNMMKMGRGRQV